MVLVLVHRFPNKQNHTRNPPKRHQPSTRNLPKRHQPPTHNPPQTKSPIPRATCPNDINRPRAIHPNEMRRGGACVPARTSAQRRFHTKNIRIMREDLNDGCALVGRRGRAHRHRPYQSPLYICAQFDTNKIPSMRNSPQTKPTVHVQSVPTNLHQTAWCTPTP